MKFVRGLKKKQISIKNYHFQLAKPHVSDEITGFSYNAVCPFGMKTRIPIILSKRIVDELNGEIWIGGGEVDLKLAVNLKEFLSVVSPLFIADVVQDTSINELI